MRIVFVSDLQTLGGAGIAAGRLANGLASLGHTVEWLYNNPAPTPFGESIHWSPEYVGPGRVAQVALNGLKRIWRPPALRAGHAISESRLLRAVGGRAFDVLHVHSLHNSYFDHRTLEKVPREVPVVWTFHDHWGFSTESYLLTGLDGATIRLKPDGSNRAGALERRRRYFASRKKLRTVANSRSTAALAKQALGIEAEVIHYGLPLQDLAPMPKTIARTAVRLPQEAFVVGFIADNREAPIKGMEVLRRALAGLPSFPRPVEAVAIGEGPCGLERSGSVTIHLFGHVLNPRLLAPLYSACDVFVVPSLADALGMVSMEAIACGTPVIGSNVGGIPDVVREGETGWLFPPADHVALGSLLQRLRETPGEASALAESCRRTAEKEWSIRRYAERYSSVYSEVVAGAN